mgnify:CR=1 FL=1|jgi:ABC-type polysaccharide/polyol phosphate transport system, ATPase component
MSSDVAIEVSGLSKSYLIYQNPKDRLKQMFMPRVARAFGRTAKPYFSEHWALRDISFSVNRGETVGIIGRNGSGKSTLLQIICGTLAATSGAVTTNGRIGALLELGAGFNPEFTGRQNAILNGQILGLTQREILDRMEEIEAFADIGAFFDRPVKTYSSGMYVRVAFAVQACIDPDILVVDEALAVGDEKFQRKCYDRFDQLRARGTSILLVTHSTTTIERFCQRAVLLHQGELHGVGPSNIIVDQYHALLYADEKAYLQFLNREIDEGGGAPRTQLIDAEAPALPASEEMRTEPNERLRAQIVSCAMTNELGQSQEVFRPGDVACVTMILTCFEDIKEIQAGLSIKTVEGVHSFGTSTLYFSNNYKDAKAGDTITVRFRLSLNLCEGVYFLSMAIAEPVSQADMLYLDKRSDVIIFKVSEPKIKATGIAYLPAQVEIIRE